LFRVYGAEQTALQLRFYRRELREEEIVGIVQEPWRIIQQPGARRYFFPSVSAQWCRPNRDIAGGA
jgi:hypothetical protein